MKKTLRLLLIFLAASCAVARGADFQFTSVGLNDVVNTIATMGKFNAMVSPELSEVVNYSRQGVEPYDALVEVAKQAGAIVTKIPGLTTDSYIVSKTDLPADVATPPPAEGALPIDFNFKDVELSSVVSTFAVLGKFQAGVAAPLADRRVTLSLHQVIANQGLYWIAVMLNAKLEETDGENGAKKIMMVPR